MNGRLILSRALLAGALLAGGAGPAASQEGARGATGRVSIHFDSVRRNALDGADSSTTEISTAVTLESREAVPGAGFDYRFDMRHSQAMLGVRPERTAIYDAYVGAHVGRDVQLRVRAGHMWLQDLGTIGTLAGALVEGGHARSKEGTRVRAGMFFGREPNIYETGYVPDVRKMGGYAAIESGFLRRHVVGYTRISQGELTERSVVSMTNYVPAGPKFFAYQAAELDVTGPAQGKGPSGLSYFLTNARFSATERIELSGTYNRGRSLDARTLTSDLLNGRLLTPQATEGLRYESRGGRVTVEVFRGTRIYGSYAQDRTNRDDALTGRVTLGGHASDLLHSGFDVSASNSRVDRPMGAYHSRYVSIGRSLGRSVYVSGDYATSLSIIQFLRSDGVIVETRPWTRRFSGSGSATLGRHVSLMLTADYTKDDAQNEVRVFSGLTYRFP